MADPKDPHARGFYNAELRPVIRALIDLPYPVLQEVRAIATSPVIPRAEKVTRLTTLDLEFSISFVIDYAYWLPWDEIRPGIDPDEIAQYAR